MLLLRLKILFLNALPDHEIVCFCDKIQFVYKAYYITNIHHPNQLILSFGHFNPQYRTPLTVRHSIVWQSIQFDTVSDDETISGNENIRSGTAIGNGAEFPASPDLSPRYF